MGSEDTHQLHDQDFTALQLRHQAQLGGAQLRERIDRPTAEDKEPEIFTVKQAPIAAGKGPARIQKPSGRSRGIHVEQLQELFLEMPGVAQGFFGDAERA